MFLTAAVILFAVAALFGATMALLHFLGRTPPKMSLAMVLGWRARPLPSALVLIPGGVALLAFATLLTAFFGL